MTTEAAPLPLVAEAPVAGAPVHDAPAVAPAPAAAAPSTWAPTLTFLGSSGLIISLLAVGALPRLRRADGLAEVRDQQDASRRRVQLGASHPGPAVRTLTLPATLQPALRADLFAQASGYVRSRAVDIGDRVEAGAVLAVLDVPLVEADLERARAAVAEAEATTVQAEKALALTRTTLARVRAMVERGVVSAQELDERAAADEVAAAALEVARAATVSRRAELRRLEQLQAFARITAPFAGTITGRTLERGDYVTAGGAGAPLFSLADTRSLRVGVDVPQAYAAGIAPAQSASVVVRDGRGAPIAGRVTRTSGALDERTRTLHVEVTIDNAAGAVLAGSYGQVIFEVPEAARPVIVPGAALIVRAEGPRVAVVDEVGLLRYVPVVVGRDLGTEVEVLKGLSGAERIVVNMSEDLPEGTPVDAVAPPPPPAPAR